MAVTLTTVTGSMELPDGSTPRLGRVIFTLTGWAKDAPHLFVQGSIDVAAAADGSFSVDLQTTDDLDVEYDVVFFHHDLSSNREISTAVGRILVPSSGPVTLASLLPVRIPGGVTDSHRIKRGDSLSLPGICLDDHDRRQSLASITVASSLLGPDGVKRSLSVTKTDADQGEIEISMSPSMTTDLPLGPHQIDVKFSVGGRVKRTLTAIIHVDQEITP